MFLANHIKDMSAEELFGVIKPVLYLIPLFCVIVLIFIVVRIFKSLSYKRMIRIMDATGYTESEKREYLVKYLSKTSNLDLINHTRTCPVCGKKYSLKTKSVNARGDIVEGWNNGGCPNCNTKVQLSNEIDHLRYYSVTRTKTNSPKENKYQKVFAKLEEYIGFYKPYVDCSSIPDNNITIDVYLH